VGNASVMRALRLLLLTLCLFGVWRESAIAAVPSTSGQAQIGFPKPLEEYNDSGTPGLFRKLAGRVKADPVNLFATIIFACAIVHTFFTARFMHIAHHFQKEFEDLADQKERSAPEIEKRRDYLQFWGQFFHFFGEVEAVFGIWLIPLFFVIALVKGWPFLVRYVTSQNAAEPVFVVVIMAIASSRPILRLAERCLAQIAALGRSTSAASHYPALVVLGFLFFLAFVEATPRHQNVIRLRGPLAGGGLTVIANAPNPAGQSILAGSFGRDGVSPGGLAVAAILPTIIMVAAFMLLP
jgi:Putative Na+/H+ antiporter